MDNKTYRVRIADKLLAEKLDAMGAVLIEGAKWCGKTMTAEQAAKSVLYLADTDTFRQNMEMIDLYPRVFHISIGRVYEINRDLPLQS